MAAGRSTKTLGQVIRSAVCKAHEYLVQTELDREAADLTGTDLSDETGGLAIVPIVMEAFEVPVNGAVGYLPVFNSEASMRALYPDAPTMRFKAFPEPDGNSDKRKTGDES